MEDGRLGSDAYRSVSVAEMRHQGNFVHLRKRVQARPGGARLVRRKAQPVHTAVDFQENPLRRMGFVCRQHVNLRFAMNRVPQVQARAGL